MSCTWKCGGDGAALISYRESFESISLLACASRPWTAVLVRVPIRQARQSG